MKKNLLLASLAIVSLAASAQTINDSVSIGSNEIWYRLSDGTQTVQPRNNWDLALETNAYGVSVRFNNIGGNSVYQAAGNDPADFPALDTTGISSWTPLYNSDTSWSTGALNNGSATYGWGEYNMISHNVEGTVTFVIKYASGTYKKFYIEKIDNTTPGNYFYSIISANLDNSDMHTASIVKQNYATKNFVYYSVLNNTVIDREPVTTDWDLLFTRYYGPVSGQMYPLTGTLSNGTVKVAQADGIADPANYADYSSHTFETAINTIGSDWKTFNGSAYVISSDRVYFVQANNNHIYKMIFTGYTGGAMATSNFSKEDLGLSTTGLNSHNNSTLSMNLYPNPAGAGEVKVLFSAENIQHAPLITITDMQGRIMQQIKADNTSPGALNQANIPVTSLSGGVYFVSIRINETVLTKKLVINN